MTGLIAEVMHAKCQQLLLEVRSDNTTAITLYQSLGFYDLVCVKTIIVLVIKV